jgi:DNA-binding MarR family transcriptional regulator
LQQTFVFSCSLCRSRENDGVRRKRKLSKRDYETLAAFRYFLRQFLRFSETAAERTGLTPQQHQSLLAIKGFPGRDYITVGELAERLQILHHSAVGLANRLAREDLIERRRNPGNRRQVYLELTRRGEKVLERLSSIHRRELRRVGREIQLLLNQPRGSDQ